MARYANKNKDKDKEQTVSARAMRNEKARQANAGKTVRTQTSGRNNTTIKKTAANNTQQSQKNNFINNSKLQRNKNSGQSAVAKRAGISQNDYNKMKNRQKNVSKLTRGNLRQIVASHAKSVGVLGGYDKQTSGRSMGKYGNVTDKSGNSGEVARKMSDWGSRQLKKGQNEVENAKKGMSKAGQFAADVYGAGLGLASDALAGPLAPVSMFSRSFGASADSAEREGASKEQAAMYGLAMGGLEAATEKISSVAKPLQKIYGKGAADELTERVLEKMMKKTGTQAGKNAVYHGGKTVMAALTEGLEEMVAEGLEPAIANQIYAEAVGKPHETSLKDVLYAGAVGGAMGGLLGAGGQVVEYGQGTSVTDIYGDDGMKALANTAKDSDEDDEALTAEALGKIMDEGGSIAAGQALQLKKTVEKQNAKDRERIQLMNAATDKLIKDNGFTNIIRKIDENGTLDLADNTRSVYEGTKAKAVSIAETNISEDIKKQLPDETIDEITSEVASIVTGTATDIDTVNMFTTSNILARQIYEQTTGEKLPETNRETREYLYNQIAKNRQTMLEDETALQLDRIKGGLIQDVAKTYDPKGQEMFSKIMENVEVRSARYVNDSIVTFEDYYEAGRMGISLQEMSDLKNPVYDALPADVREAAYDAGVQDQIEARSTAKDLALTLGQKVNKNRSQANSAASRGKVIHEFENRENKLKFSASQQKMFQSFAKEFNINIHITDNPNYNGNYVNGEVWMSVDADRDLSYVFAHEITHHLQKFAPQEYNDFKELVRNAWGPEKLNAAIKAKQAHYAQHNVKLSREDAFDEILADSTYEMIQDPAFVTELISEDRGLARQILDALKNLIKKIRTMLAGNDFTPAQNEALLSQLDILKEAEKLWETGLKKAVENRDAVGMIDSDGAVQYQLNTNFASEVDAWYNNTVEFNKPGGFFKIGTTSDALKSIGVKDYDITWDKSKIKKILENHEEMTIDVIKDVPNVIENPIIVMQSKTRLNSITLFGEVYADDIPVLVAIQLNPKSKKGKVLNFAKVASAYGKNDVQSMIDSSDILYIDDNKKRTDDWLSANRLQLPSGLTQYGSIGTVTYYDPSVNNDNSGPTAMQLAMQKAQQNKKYSLKDQQFEIIQQTNPMMDGYHTGIRSVDDILTFEEALNDSGWEGWQEDGFDPDYTGEMAQEALDTGRITVYSSYPIENGVFVTPSRMEAESYSGTGDIHEMTVALEDVAWIDPTQGQYAKVQTVEEDSAGRELSPQQQKFFAKSKARDENGNLVPVFHTSRAAGFTEFDNEFSDDELSFFFSDSFELSQTYARSANRPAFVDRVENLDGLKKLLAFNEDAPGRGMLEFMAKNDDYEILYEDLDEFIEAYDKGEASDVTYFEIAGVSGDVDGIEADIVEGTVTAEAALGHLINQANDNLNQLIYDPGYYEVYLNLKNPLIINGDGRNWNDIQVGIPEEYEDLSSDINEKIDRYVELVRIYDSNSDRSLVMDSLGDLTAALDVIAEEDEEHDYFTAEELDELTELTTALDDFYYDWQENEHYDNFGEEIWFKDLLEYEGNTYTTRDIASMAYDQGYDGVIIRNITDSGQYGSGAEAGDVYIAFTSEQIKAVTNTTPTMHGDIRYSLKDSEGRELSANQAEYFKDSKVRDENGNLLVMYHGTDSYEEFNVFKSGKSGYLGKGMYFSDSEAYAKRYATKNGYDGRIYKTYLNVKNPLVVTSENPAVEILGEKLAARREKSNSFSTTWIKPSDIKKLVDKGYDGIIWKYGATIEVSVWNSNQIKNIDNENPTTNPDIRYSFKDDENIIDEEKALTYNNINDLENDLKERWTAYETDEESRRIAAEAIRDLSESKYSLSDSRRTVAGVREVVADGLSREFINKGFVDFRGRRVNTAKDLAELMQVHRDPRFETFRIVYMKGNKIVGTEAISAQMPGFAPVFTQEEGGFYNRFKYMKERMSRLKADGYYLLHNHPSGIPEPSGPDIRVSEVYATEVPGYKGHVILDHDTYGSVEFNNNDTAGMVHQLGEQMSVDLFKVATVDHPLLDEVVTGSEKVAQICKAVENNDYVASLIFIDSRGRVKGIENVSNAIINNHAELPGYLRNAARYYGARAVAMGTNDPEIAAKTEVHIEQQTLLDCIWFYGNGDISGWESMRAQMPGYVIPNMAFGKDEDEYGGKRVNEDDFNDDYDYHDGINISEDDVNDYVNGHPEEFPDVLPYWETERDAHRTRQQTMQELQAQLERMKFDKKLTHGRVLDPKSIEEDVNSLIRILMSYSEGTTKRTDYGLIRLIQANAKNIFHDLKAGNTEDAILTAYHTAEEVVQNLQLVNDEMFNEYKELREYLRTTRVSISEEDRSNIPDFNDFRKKQMGRLRIVNEGGMSVDNMYLELQEMYPGMFDPELTHPADQLMEIAEVRSSLDPYDIMLSHEETEQLIKETAHDILELTVNGKPWKSWADRNKEVYDDKIKALKQKHQEALRDVRQKEKDRAEKKIEAYKAKANEKLQQTKEKGEQKLQEEKQKNKERQQKQRDARNSREYIAKMEKQISWLSDRLLKPTDDKHLPEGYQKAIAQLLYALDTQSERSKKLEEKYGVSQKRLKFLALKEQYEKIAEQPDSDIMIDEDIAAEMSLLSELLEDQEISEATPAQLEQIYKVLRNIRHGISMVNKAFDENNKAMISEMAEATIQDAQEKKRHIDRTGMIGGIDSILNESMVTPRDFFERIGGGVEQAYMGIRKGFDRHVDNISTARTFFEGVFKKYYNKKKPGSALEKWRDDSTNETFQLESGGNITLNVAQRMSLYCLMKREQAQGHILGSGIVATEVDAKSKVKQIFGAKMDVKANAARITFFDVDNILKTLTPEQIKMADELQGFLNGECAAWGNEVSMKMYGYEKFTEENYFPIKSADVYLESQFDGRTSIERIRNFGFTKGTVVNANNPIVIDDIFSVVSDHINHMSMYNGFAAPIADFTRVYNYKSRAEDGTLITSTKAALQETYGKKVGSYITKFMADLQSNTQTRTEGLTRLVNKTLANYKKATIGGNLRVALQQPTAIMRAFMLISPKYFTKVNAKENMARMKEHCQVARWKSWGHNQVDMARDIDDIMMNNEWTKLDLVTMQVYGALDNVTWSFIWGAVENEIQATHPEVKVDSDEYFELCNDRASEIFDKTQVVDSVLHRSEVMRNQDTMSKMITSFMAEPTRTYNMVRGQYAKALDSWRDGNKAGATAIAWKASAIFLMNAMVCAAAAAVADALRGKDLDGDDEPEEWWEYVWHNFLGNANPMMMIPVMSELLNYWQGWGSQNMALKGIESLVTSTKSLFDKMNGGKEDKTWGELIRKEVESMGLVFGIPVKNILREMETFGKLIGYEASAATTTEESKEPLLDKPLDRLSIEDGTFVDNVLNRFGLNRTEAEKAEHARKQTIKNCESKMKGLSGKEREDKAWDLVMEGYTKDIKDGNIQAIEDRRLVLEALGGDLEYFDERVQSEVTSAYKKTIGVNDVAGEVLKDYLISECGYTEGKISNEIIAKSDAAKNFQIALCENDRDAAVDALSILIDAGLTYEDGYALYINKNRAISANDYSTGEFTAPVSGRVTSNFGYRNAPTAGASSYHEGMDIAAAAGTIVGAADGGKVSSCGYNKTEGNWVKISHGNGRYTVYKHLQGYCVEKGQAVNAGQEIGKVGSTGVSTGPHLHFAVMENGTYVDPAPYLN